MTQGEGSRGGHIIGHTRSGAAIYGTKKDPAKKKSDHSTAVMVVGGGGMIYGTGMQTDASVQANRIFKVETEKEYTRGVSSFKNRYASDVNRINPVFKYDKTSLGGAGLTDDWKPLISGSNSSTATLLHELGHTEQLKNHLGLSLTGAVASKIPFIGKPILLGIEADATRRALRMARAAHGAEEAARIAKPLAIALRTYKGAAIFSIGAGAFTYGLGQKLFKKKDEKSK